MSTIYDFSFKNSKGEDVSLSDLKGKILLIVNTATGCGFTPQYEGLEKLYEEYHDKGLEILDFPCNQFGHQAPGSNEEIANFCTAKYHTQFEQLAKVDVNGENAIPLFKWLSENKRGPLGKAIKWNFTKFLVDRDGKIIKRYEPVIKPEKIEKDIKGLI